jgi:hypothetical protein
VPEADPKSEQTSELEGTHSGAMQSFSEGVTDDGDPDNDETDSPTRSTIPGSSGIDDKNHRATPTGLLTKQIIEERLATR